jgi:lysyl-tRNA synthetase class 1
MFWGDKVAASIIASGLHVPYWVDDMFTPSGYAHVGSIIGPVIHDVLYRALTDAGKKATTTYVFNDFDPIDGLPSELQKDFGGVMGVPLRLAPSPVKGYESFGEYFSKDFQKTLRELGVEARWISSFDLYRQGKFNQVIREALDGADTIIKIYRDVAKSRKKEKGWLPLQVVCEKCGKLGTTRVHDWNGEIVEYTCEPDMVAWARGCGHRGTISPFDGNAKLPWKVDWPAHWKVLGVTIEGAGKDHMTAGGSRDIADAICERVFHILPPFKFSYEHFLLGGRKMSSSKGIGLKSRDITKILPPTVARFLFVRNDYRQAIEFNPFATMVVPDLFDEFDRCWQAYGGGKNDDFARAFALSWTSGNPPKEKIFVPRFRDVANYIQLPNVNLAEKFSEIKGSPFTALEQKVLEERMKYARIWIDGYAPDEYRNQLISKAPKKTVRLSEKQKMYLAKVVALLGESSDADALQQELYEAAKEISIPPKEAFGAIYQVTLGKKFGPKAAWFLLQYPKDDIINRLQEAIR